MSTDLLQVEALDFGYGRKAVGKGVSFTCREGEALALLGPNGSGKTTLFKTLLGLLPPLAGRIRVAGEDIRDWSAAQRARSFGYVPQAAPGYFAFSVYEAVMMGRTARIGTFSAPAARDRQVVERVLDEMGIAQLAERAYTEISGGERQLVVIARALAQEPRILVLDEPTASLDFGNQVLVLETIRRLAASGLTVILSTHHPDQAFACAERSALLKDGRVVAIGATGETLTDESLSALYGTPLTVRHIDGWTSCVPATRRSGSHAF
ncbi:ABC transporter ATP-binding protein [Fodinicurvata halophila]|uniref:ABC transporter ATP-binding protein n=1 Tax=Fodinicurvata halophila TaxID=1419723 RepID=A0ABV8UQN9_9PROT